MRIKVLSVFLLLLVSNPLLCQHADSLQMIGLKKKIYSSKEFREWQNAALEFQTSKLQWLTYRKQQPHLVDYDYEWRTSKWKEIQERLRHDNAQSDSLRTILAKKTKLLYAKFSELSNDESREHLFQELYGPVADSIKKLKSKIQKNRY